MRALVVSAVVALAIVVSMPTGRPAPPRAHSPAPDAGARLTRAQRPAAAPNALGIDVGDYQHTGGPIQWDVVATQYQFAFIKATEGNSYVNPYYAGDSKAALAAGLLVGGYAFATPDDASGADEAKYFLQQSGYAANRKLLFPMIDLEWNPYDTNSPCYGLDPPDLVSWIRQYSDTIYKALGVRPIIYTQASFWNDCTGGAGVFNADPLWVGSDEAATSTDMPAGFASWVIWQNGVGSATGVAGPVDVDVFNGTEAQLQSELTNPNAKVWHRYQPLHAYAAGLRRRSPPAVTVAPWVHQQP